MLLDASGSMNIIKADTLAGINTFIEGQKHLTITNGVDRPIDLSPDLSGNSIVTCNYTLATFTSGNGYNFGANFGNVSLPNGEPKDYSYEYNILYNNVDINTVPPLTASQYHPDGGTPLIDAFCKCIDDTKRQLSNTNEDQKPGRVIFVCITDGQENTSTKFKKADLTQRIMQQTDLNWQFVFLGANQDAIGEAQDVGIAAGNSMSYSTSADGIRAAYASTSNMVAMKRSVGVEDMQFTNYVATDYAAQDRMLGSNVNARHFTTPQTVNGVLTTEQQLLLDELAKTTNAAKSAQP